MKILLVGSYEYKIYASAFEYGFKTLGHDVSCLDSDDYLFPGSCFFARFVRYIQKRFHIGFLVRKYNRDILKKAITEKPDFIFLYRCYDIYGKTIKTLKHNGIFVMTYNNDDPFCNVPSKSFFSLFLDTIKYADLNFVYRQKNIDDYLKNNVDNARILLPYYRTQANYRIDTIRKDIPIAFIGHYENDGRDIYIKALKEAGLPVTVFASGGYWNQSPFYDSIKDIMLPEQKGDSYNITINRTQIALVFLSKINHDTYTRRCFEIPATETLMMAEYTEDLDKMFPEDYAAVYFRNKEELIYKCKQLLSNVGLISQIAHNGYKRLLEIHGSEIDRCDQIVATYKDMIAPLAE